MNDGLTFIPDEPDTRLASALEKLAEAIKQPPVVNVAAPNVSVAAPSVSVEPAKQVTHWSFKIVRDPATQRITEINAHGR